MLHASRRSLGAFLAAGLAIGMLAAPVGAGGAATHYVGPGGGSGPCAAPAFSSIGAGVAAAAPNDTILVCPGTYHESVTVGTAGLTIRATEPWQAVVEPPTMTTSGLETAPLLGIDAANRVTVQWLKFVIPAGGSCGSVSTVIAVTGASRHATIRSNRISAKSSGACGYNNGIAVVGASSAWVGNNLVTNFGDDGIVISEAGSRATIVHNSVRFRLVSGTGGGFGIEVSDGAAASISGNAVVGLASAMSSTPILNVGIFAASAAPGVVVRNNLVRYAEYGIVIYAGSNGAQVRDNTVKTVSENGMDINAVSGVLVQRNTISGALQHGIAVIEGSSGNTLRGNTISGSGGYDCDDETSGTGTGGTANTWINDHGATENVPGICTAD